MTEAMLICHMPSAIKGTACTLKARRVSWSNISLVLSTPPVYTKNSLDEHGFRKKNSVDVGVIYTEYTKKHDGSRAGGDKGGEAWNHLFKKKLSVSLEGRKTFKGHKVSPKRAAKRKRAIDYLVKVGWLVCCTL